MTGKKPRTRARARIRITVEIDAAGVWGGECTVDQVRRQGVEAVEDALRRGLVINGLSCSNAIKQEKTPATLIGEPKLTMVVVEDGES